MIYGDSFCVVRCNNCGQLFFEKDLVKIVEDDSEMVVKRYPLGDTSELPKSYQIIDGCPTCLDDACLMDLDIEALWSYFGDVPMNPVTEKIEADFLHFPVGTPREDVWHWFDKIYPDGVASLLGFG